MWTHLYERAATAGKQRLGDALELHRLTHIAIPIVGSQLRGLQDAASDGGVEGDSPLARHDAGASLEQLVSNALHLRGVRRIVHRNPTCLDPLCFTLHEQSLQCIQLTRYHHGPWTVDRSKRQPTAKCSDACFELLHTGHDRNHSPETSQGS